MGVDRDEPLWWWLFMLFMGLIPKEPGLEEGTPEYREGPGFHGCMLEGSDPGIDLLSVPGLRDDTMPMPGARLAAPGRELRAAGAEVR